MSLQVWLPLNGDLNNQGLNNVTITNNGAVIDDNGKIGKCYLFDGNAAHTIGTTTIALTDVSGVSLTGWIKLNDLTTNQIFFGLSASASSDSLFRLYYNKERTPNELVIYAKAFKYFPLSNFTMDTNWHHYAITYNGSSVALYVDGIFIGSQSASMTLDDIRKLFINGSLNAVSSSAAAQNKAFGLNGYANDVRVYDHCLSPKEVEEIAKGLVLHYHLAPLNLSWLLPNSEKIITRSSSNTFVDYDYYPDLISNSATSYTVDFWAKGSVADMKLDVYFRDSGGSSFAITTIQTLTTNWKHYSLALSGSSANLNLFRARCYGGTAGDIIYIRNMRLLSNNMPIRDTIIYDSSGYANNGTISGSLVTTSPSPRYDVATAFPGVNTTYITCHPFATNCSGRDELTFCFWVYKIASGTIFSLEKNYYWQFTLIDQKLHWRDNSVSPTGTRQQLNIFKSIPTNTWTFLCITYKQNILKSYINGEILNTITINGTALNTNLNQFILGVAMDKTNSFTGNLSDFRVYVTALTAEQVTDLYRTSMSIDSSGNIHARELKEV